MISATSSRLIVTSGGAPSCQSNSWSFHTGTSGGGVIAGTSSPIRTSFAATRPQMRNRKSGEVR